MTRAQCDNFFRHSPVWQNFAQDIHRKYVETSKDYKDFLSSLELIASILNEPADTYKDYYFQYSGGSTGGFFAFDKLMHGYDDAHKACKGTPSGYFPQEGQ